MFYKPLFAVARFKGNWASEFIFFCEENILSKNSIPGSFRSNKKFYFTKNSFPYKGLWINV